MKKLNIKGITLIALVITIIVLLILAGVSIATLTGDNGILTKAQMASAVTKEASIKEEIETEIMASFDDKGKFDAKTFKEKMKESGAEITKDTEDEIVVEKDGYEATIDAKTGEIKKYESVKGVTPVIEVTVGEYDASSKKVTITVEVTNEVGQVDSIIVTNLDTGDTYEAEISGKTGTVQVDKNGTYKIEVKATTDGGQKTKEATETVGKIPVTFTTAQGKIDVIWVNKANQKIDKPLVPDTLPSGMKKVYWTKSGDEIKEIKEGDGGFTESEWYSYEEGKGSEDNTSSKWANAINTTTDGEESYESYFVWIPRYAYKITYLTTDGQVAGYCDGDGIRDIAGNKKPETQNLKEDKGIETVEYNGFKYIVHPAFEGNIDNGGWKDEEKRIEDLQGIWVGKYESARSTATATSSGSGTTAAIQIAPTVKSWVDIKIGDCYDKAKSYDTTKDSHLMKNSEWGAVAYLTYSQYGRNGKEVDINRCSSYVTGMGSGRSASTYSYSADLAAQMYNGEKGQLASSTGNIYGVYDLSGGAWEYVAAFNDKVDSNDYESKYGISFAAPTNSSTRYTTKYSSDSSTPAYGKYYPGDATFEVYTGSGSTGWNSDYSYFAYPTHPFFERGGAYDYGTGAGVFSAMDNYGGGADSISFRVTLPGV